MADSFCVGPATLSRLSDQMSDKDQNQVQSAYYDLPQVVLHPAVIFNRCLECTKIKTTYKVFVSDDHKRDPAFVNYCLEKVMKSCELED